MDAGDDDPTTEDAKVQIEIVAQSEDAKSASEDAKPTTEASPKVHYPVNTVVVSCASRPSEAEREQNMPTCCTQVQGVSLIRRSVRAFFTAGLTTAVVIVGFGGEKIKKELNSDEQLRNIKLMFLEMGEDYNRGWCPSIMAAQGVVPKGVPFLLATSDHLFHEEVMLQMKHGKLPSSGSNGADGALVLVDTTPGVMSLKDFHQGVKPIQVQCEGAKIIDIGNMKDSSFQADGVEAGLFLCSDKVFEAVDEVGHSHQYYTFDMALKTLAGRGVLHGQCTTTIQWWSAERIKPLQGILQASDPLGAVERGGPDSASAHIPPLSFQGEGLEVGLQLDEKRRLEICTFFKIGMNTAHTVAHLGGNLLTGKDIGFLASLLVQDAIASPPPNLTNLWQTLAGLNLEANRIGPEGAWHIAQMLRKNSILRSLKLGRNQLSHPGAQAVGEALEHNNTLTSLSLGGNDLGPKGAEVLAESLKRSTGLKELRMGGNAISDQGAKAVASMLEKNRSLTCLHLYGNDISEEGVQSLVDVLQCGMHNVVQLGLGGNLAGEATGPGLFNRKLDTLKRITRTNKQPEYRKKLMLTILMSQIHTPEASDKSPEESGSELNPAGLFHHLSPTVRSHHHPQHPHPSGSSGYIFRCFLENGLQRHYDQNSVVVDRTGQTEKVDPVHDG